MGADVVALRFRSGPSVPLRQLIALVAGTALLACLISDQRLWMRSPQAVPPIASPLGAAADHPTQVGSTSAGRRQAEKAGIDVDSIADRVSHRVIADPRRPGRLVVQDKQAGAAFDAAGFHVTPAGSTRGLSVAVTAVGRSDSASARPLGAWTPHANIATRTLAHGVTERVTASSAGLEWDVVLNHRPAGTGPLRIDADLGGVVRARRTNANGHPALQLTLRDGKQMRMTEMVVVDARGTERYRALPRVDGSRLRMDVPDTVLSGARYPLTVDPTVSVNHPVGTTGAADDQTLPAVAWNGTNFLVVWLDNRAFGQSVSAARVNAAGALLDPTGIPLPTGAVTEAPAVASDGNGFLVVWADPRNGGQNDIYGARVSGSGAVLDGTGFPISTAAGGQDTPSIAWNGANFLVAWGSGGDVRGTRVTSAGALLAPTEIPISTAPDGQGNPTVAALGSVFFVAWADGRNGGNVSHIYGARVNGAGAVLDAGGIVISPLTGHQTTPDVASNGSNLLVVWLHNGPSPTLQIQGARWNSAGTVLDTTPIPLSPGGFELAPSVTRSGANFLVSWEEFRLDTSSFDIRGTRVSNGGAVLDAGGLAISAAVNHETDPALAWNGTNNIAVWADTRDGGVSDIYGSRVSGGTVLDPAGMAISTDLPEHFEWDPQVVWNGSMFLVVWEDGRSGIDEDVYAARLDAQGNLRDPAGIRLSTAPDGQFAPTVAWNGTNFLVAWEDFRSGSNYDIYATRIDPSGAVLDTLGIPISPAAGDQLRPTVGSNGTNFFVAWQDHRGGASADVYGTRVTTAGAVVDATGIPISTATNDQTTPTVTSNGSEYFTAWADARTSAVGDIYGTRIAGAVVQNPTGIPISTASGAQRQPASAWNGSHYLVVWQDLRSGASDIYGARLDGAGIVLDGAGIPITMVAGSQDAATVAATGSTFLVAWRGGSTSYDILASRVNDAGVVQDTSGFAVASTSSTETSPAASSGPGGGWGVTHVQQQGTGQGIYLHIVAPK